MTKMIVFAIAAALAAAAPAEIYERDTPFNGGTITSAAPGALDPADTHPGLNLIPWPKSIATLLQALSQSNGQVALPKFVIKDWPHADYCAMMIDCGRQEQPIEWLKKMIETCRLYKVRYVHLHLTDDQGWCFPSATYPQLGSKNHGTHGGLAPKVYPLEELKGLVAYADARGIALVPELEVPGHSGAALRSLPLASSSGCPPSPSSPPPLSPRPARATCFSPCSPGTAKTRPSARPPAPAASRSGRVISA